jgi:hypothetical protein
MMCVQSLKMNQASDFLYLYQAKSLKSQAFSVIPCNMAPTPEVSNACPREAAQCCRCRDWATG